MHKIAQGNIKFFDPLEPKTILPRHQAAYAAAKHKLDNEKMLNIKALKQRLSKKRIHCVKYHFNLDQGMQNACQYQAEMYLDKEELVIVNFKPEEGFFDDQNYKDANVYSAHRSKASFNINEIEGLIYGGFSSRFWMLRKHIISLSFRNVISEELPFFSWHCLTVQLHGRDIDLVIPNEKDLFDLITLLSYQLNTLDGSKDSA